VTEIIQQKDIFNDPLFDRARWPKRPYCTDDPATYGTRIRGLKQALTRAYIQANPPHIRVWTIYDCDYPGAILAWEERNLPPPSWAAKNRENGHAHLVWGLSAPVLVAPEARDGPIRYLAAIEGAFTATLAADPGFTGILTKNPAHPRWHVLRGPRIGYELNELAEWVDLDRFKPKRGRKVAEVGVGRNVTLFDRLRYWAYRNVLEYKREGGLGGWNAWLSACNSRALVLNGDFAAPLDGREVWWVAKSVAKWTWRRFSLEKRRELIERTHRPEIQAQRGRKGGKKSGEVRRAMSEEKRASARLMRAQGMSIREIAAELGVGKSTVADWLR